MVIDLPKSDLLTERVFWNNWFVCVRVFNLINKIVPPHVGEDPFSFNPPFPHPRKSYPSYPTAPPSNPSLSAKSEINSFLKEHLRIFRQSQLLIDCYSTFKFWFHLHNESVQGLMGGKRNTDVDSVTIWPVNTHKIKYGSFVLSQINIKGYYKKNDRLLT